MESIFPSGSAYLEISAQVSSDCLGIYKTGMAHFKRQVSPNKNKTGEEKMRLLIQRVSSFITYQIQKSYHKKYCYKFSMQN